MLSKNEVHSLVVTIRCSSALSVMGSTAMIIDILKSGNVRKQCRLRILMGVSIFDIMSSLAFFMGPWLTEKTPAGEYYGLSSYGNYYTCQTQGFFASLTVGSYCYNLCLAIFYVLAVKYSKTENWFKSNVEPWMHFMSVSYSLTISIAMLPFGFDAYAIKDLMLCTASMENEYAVNAIYRFSQVIIWLIFILMIVLYWAVKEQQKIVASYRHSMSIRASQSRKVARQCFAFSGSFFIAYVPLLISYHLKSDEPLYLLAFLVFLCAPILGFLNAIVYFLPRIVAHLTNFKHRRSMQAISE